MIEHTINKHEADPIKVFITGPSSGYMSTNVMMATYPDASPPQHVTLPFQRAVSQAPQAHPPRLPTQPRPTAKRSKQPKIEIALSKPCTLATLALTRVWRGWRSASDSLVKYPHFAEQLKEWSGIFGFNFWGNVTNTPQSGYTQMVYGDGTKLVGYSAHGVGHAVPAHEMDRLKWFGL
jgi:acetylxylan esterase